MKIKIPTALEVTSRPELDVLDCEYESPRGTACPGLAAPITIRSQNATIRSFTHLEGSRTNQQDANEATIAWRQEQTRYANTLLQQSFESPPPRSMQTSSDFVSFQHALARSPSINYPPSLQSSRLTSICSPTIMTPTSCRSFGPFTPQQRNAHMPLPILSPTVRSEFSGESEEGAGFDVFGYLAGKGNIWSKH